MKTVKRRTLTCKPAKRLGLRHAPTNPTRSDWDEHFRWVRSQPAVDEKLLAELLRRDR